MDSIEVIIHNLKEEQKERIVKWVAALRSGKYKQAKYYLRDGGGFCCLGVACDLSGLSEWDFYGGGRAEYFENDRSLPFKVMAYYGLTEQDPILDIEEKNIKKSTYLSTLNDEGMSFAEIADVIEQNYLGEE